MIKIIELFAGIGSQAEAFNIANIPYKTVGISEIDKYAIQGYEKLHGKVNNFGDITKIKELPQADLWTYSFPCQDISIAGKLKGFDKENDTRSGLLWEVGRLLKIAKNNNTLPKYLLMENVKNIIGEKFIDGFNEWVKELNVLGYDNYYQVLNAKDYGIPQNRERVFMVSILKTNNDYTYQYHFPPKTKLELRLKDFLEDEVDEKYFISDKLFNCFTDMTNRNGFIRGKRFKPHSIDSEYAYTISTGSGNRATDNYIKIPENTKKGYKEAYEGDGVYINRPHQKRGVVQKDIIQTLKTSSNDLGVVVKGTRCLSSKVNNKQPSLTNRVYDSNYVATCVTTSPFFMPHYTHKLRIRKLTPRECLRLMGWKDERIDLLLDGTISNTQLYKIAGNSIVIQVLVEIFKSLFNEDEKSFQQVRMNI